MSIPCLSLRNAPSKSQSWLGSAIGAAYAVEGAVEGALDDATVTAESAATLEDETVIGDTLIVRERLRLITSDQLSLVGR